MSSNVLSDLAKVTWPVVESGQELGSPDSRLMFFTTTGSRQQEKAILFISGKCNGTFPTHLSFKRHNPSVFCTIAYGETEHI